MRRFPRYPIVLRQARVSETPAKGRSIMVYITIGNFALTVVAAFFAAVTIYYNFLRVSDSLQGRVAWGEATAGPIDDSTLTLQAIIVNTGNRQAVVTQLSISEIAPKGGALTSYFQRTDPLLPLLIQPSQIQIVKVSAPLRAWDLNGVECDSTSPPHSPGDKCANLGISWSAIKSKGQTFTAAAQIGQITFEQRSTHESLHGYSLIDTTINLFSTWRVRGS